MNFLILQECLKPHFKSNDLIKVLNENINLLKKLTIQLILKLIIKLKKGYN